MLMCPKYCSKMNSFVLIRTRRMIILVNENKGKFKDNLKFLNYISNYWTQEGKSSCTLLPKDAQ